MASAEMVINTLPGLCKESRAFQIRTFTETLPSLTFQNNNNVKDNQLLAGYIPVVLPCSPCA